MNRQSQPFTDALALVARWVSEAELLRRRQAHEQAL